MATANLKLRQEKGRAEIAAMAVTVDQIAKQYGPDSLKIDYLYF